MVWSKSPRPAVLWKALESLEGDFCGMALSLHLNAVLSGALRLGTLSLNIPKHHCFSSEKHHLTPKWFCSIVFYYLGNLCVVFFMFPLHFIYEY